MEVGGAVHRGGTGEYRQQWRVNGSGQGWTGIGGRAVRVKRVRDGWGRRKKGSQKVSITGLLCYSQHSQVLPLLFSASQSPLPPL